MPSEDKKETHMGLATTALRVVTGATMAGHGLQKLTRSFGGGGPDAAGDGFESMGLAPGKTLAMLTGATETAGGTMMVAGLGTPLACAMVTGVMTAAIAKVHYKNGFWSANGGFEYNLHIMAATFAVAAAGGGALTLDGLRGKKHRGLGWALAQLAVGASAAAGALALAGSLEPGRSSAKVSSESAPGDEQQSRPVDLVVELWAEDEGPADRAGTEVGAHQS
jgi:putative oxidoreductase